MNNAVQDYYRWPEECAVFQLLGQLTGQSGYFHFGPETTCFGQLSSRASARSVEDQLPDVVTDVRIEPSKCWLPFNPDIVVANLRHERYLDRLFASGTGSYLREMLRRTYYLVRPWLPVSVRAPLQRAALRGWDKIIFPRWPLDVTVERVFQSLLVLSMRARGIDRLPFIWFWPHGYRSCAIMTHDIETAAGLDFCSSLMDIEDSHGIKSSFQIIPEKRYRVSQRLLEGWRGRGFEINVHDLDHDGRLYNDRNKFIERVRKINRYGRDYAAAGFRSGTLYRNVDWYEALEFSYDMSVPNVAHLDPQRGGCCSVMPYFIGKVLELPLTTTQDYTLFQLLRDYSINLWKEQMHLILEEHGLMSFIIHPDYIISERPRKSYLELLEHLSRLRSEERVWIALPGDVNRWWRERGQMSLRFVDDQSQWVIDGPGKERAVVAYAALDEGKLTYVVPDVPSAEPPV